MYLGIDIGTSAVKALLFDEAERIGAQANVPLSVSQPQPGWSEQHPDQWWQAVCQALRQLGEQSHLSTVQAIGLSGQMHGAVCLDAKRQPLRPALLWNDGRSQAQAVLLNRALPELGQVAGVPAMAGFTATKILWLAEHEPDLHRQICHVLLPKDYVRLQLCGELGTDMSDAAGTLWLDQAARTWCEQHCEASATQPRWLPPLGEACELAGRVTPEAARATGLRTGTPMVFGAGDAAAGGIGIGATEPGDAFISLGTSGQLFVAQAEHIAAPQAFVHAFAHALPQRWFQMAAMLNGASPLRWLSTQLQQPIDTLLEGIQAQTVQADTPLFLPYLVGERTPHNNPHARASFFGLSAQTSHADLTLSVLEGVCHSFADALQALRQAGTEVTHLGAIGGGARSDAWLQLMADVLQVPLARYAGAELGPAFGAARLARLGYEGGAAEVLCQKPRVEREFMPRPQNAERHAQRYQRFQQLYRATETL